MITKMQTVLLVALASQLFPSSQAFVPTVSSPRIFGSCVIRSSDPVVALDATSKEEEEEEPDSPSIMPRRDMLSTGTVMASAFLLDSLSTKTAWASDDDLSKAKVLVLGGSGFVGSQVVAKLQAMGVSTIATSRDGRDGTAALDVTSESNLQDKVKSLASGCSGVISCIGAIGTADDEIINAATAAMAAGAKAAGVQHFVYITVAPEVKEFAKDIDFLKGYMRGKTYSRDAVISSFGSKATLIEPTFIYGGGSFELNPPRVASFYGKFIEGVLSSSPLRAITNVAPAGLIKIALEPPVPVETVAAAAAAGALGRTAPVLDTYDKIKEAASLL